MRVHAAGRAVTVGPESLLAAGGEGTAWASGDHVFKIWHDLTRVPCAGRLSELATVGSPDVIVPDIHVYDDAGRRIGVRMPRAPGWPAERLTARSFRERVGADLGVTLDLVRRARDTLHLIHEAGLLVVDLRCANWVVPDRLDRVSWIDTTSWQTPSFPATALADTVRDRHADGLSRQTDWFAFAVTAFQLLTGLHPYRGKHPHLTTLDARMMADASVLQRGVLVPPAYRSAARLPRAWRDWFWEVFQERCRDAPPQSSAPPAPRLVDAPATQLTWAPLLKEPGIRRVDIGRGLAVHTADSVIVDGTRVPGRWDAVGWTRSGAWVAARCQDSRLELQTSIGPLHCEHAADAVVSHAGRLLVLRRGRIVELVIRGDWVAPRVLANGPAGTQLFPGVATQPLPGGLELVVLPPTGGCHRLRLAELEGARVLDACLAGRVVSLAIARDGLRRRLRLRFDPDWRTWDVEETPDPGGQGIDVAVGPHVVVECGDGLTLARPRPGCRERRRLDVRLGGRLLSLPDGIGVIRPDGLWRVSLGGSPEA